MNEARIDVLIVEDNPQDAELIEHALKRQHLGESRCVVRDGAAALDVLFGPDAIATPRLILLDLKLPKIDGFQVLQRIKNVDRTKQVPVVVLTSSGVEEDIRTAYALRANSYVVKPMRYESFMETIGRVGTYWLRSNRPPPLRLQHGDYSSLNGSSA